MKLNDLKKDSDATSLYLSVMWDDNPIYPRIEAGYAFTPDLNDESVERFNNQTFTQGSAGFKK